MPSGSTLIVFALTSLALLLIPGPAVLYIVARSGAQGFRAGMVSVLGVHTGSLLHVAAAVVGLSAIVVASSVAFTGVKVLGGAYLIYLGLRALLDPTATPTGIPAARSLRRLYVDGLVVNTLNPKVALFFLAFLPQFVSPDRGPVWAQTLLLGVCYIGLGLTTDTLYAALGDGVGRRLRSRLRPRVGRDDDRVDQAVGVTLGRVQRGSGVPFLARLRGRRTAEGCLLIGLGVVALAVPARRPTPA